MNKAIVLLAVVASAAIVSGVAVPEERQTIFADFCEQTRVDLKAKATGSTNKAAAELFELFSNELTGALENAAQTGKNSIERETTRIKSDAKTAFSAGKNVAYDVAKDFGQGIYNKIMAGLDHINDENAIKAYHASCNYLIQTLKPEYVQKLDQYKEQVKTSGSHSGQVAVIDETNFANVGCSVTKVLEALSRSCEAGLKLKHEDFADVGLVKRREDEVETETD